VLPRFRGLYRIVLLGLALGFAFSRVGLSLAAAPEEIAYEVRPGDTLSAIAQATGTQIGELIALNDLADANLLIVGQRLRVPKRAPSAQPPFVRYAVQPGDTLYRIAATVGVPLTHLIELNQLADPDQIAAGQLLLIPQRAGTGTLADRRPSPTARVVTNPERGAVAARSMPTPTPPPTGTAPALKSAAPAIVVTALLPSIPGASPLPRATAQAIRAPSVVWTGVPSFWPGRPHGEPIALVLHVAGGSLAGMDQWFADPDNLSSAHFGVGLDGRIHQYVDLADRAWANGFTEPGNRWPGPTDANPNDWTVSIELEDQGIRFYDVPAAQYLGAVAVGRLVRERYPKLRYLISHRAIAPASRAHDPGPSWIESGRFAALARDLGLIPIP
jgi:LysM repeat protein